jgi:hypothetical protein
MREIILQEGETCIISLPDSDECLHALSMGGEIVSGYTGLGPGENAEDRNIEDRTHEGEHMLTRVEAFLVGIIAILLLLMVVNVLGALGY